MSTRSIVGMVDSANRVVGRYVHSDGYPTGMGRELSRLLAEYDGSIEHLMSMLTEQHAAWDFLDRRVVDPDDIEGVPSSRDQLPMGPGLLDDPVRQAYELRHGFWRECVPVKGVGLAFPRRSLPVRAPLSGPVGELRDIEWVYGFTSLDPSSAELVVVANDRFTRFYEVARVPARELHRTDWSRIECGEHYERCVHIEGFHDACA